MVAWRRQLILFMVMVIAIGRGASVGAQQPATSTQQASREKQNFEAQQREQNWHDERLFVQSVTPKAFDEEFRAFMTHEVSAHVADIASLDPAPDRVVGALATGEFSWGTFLRALAAYSEYTDAREIDGRAIAPMIGRMAEIEVERGGKSWAQLDAAEALASYGTDRNKNALWQTLTPKQKGAFRTLLDPSRFYDSKTRQPVNLPQNYLGVAARIAAIRFELGLDTDRAAADALLDAAAKQFTGGALYADDAPPTGRYDRYSNEYARALYEAAGVAGRADLQKALAPSLKAQVQLWWDLLSPDGYGYPWGRSIGDISYMDTMEIAAFAAKYPEFRPAPLAALVAAYTSAWESLRNDYNQQTHLLSIFAFGRGEYSYINKEREWQQATAFFAKAMDAQRTMMAAMSDGVIQRIAAGSGARVRLPDVDRFVRFGAHDGREFGVWIYRRTTVRFALPFVTGPKAATSDYLPAPFGFSAFAAPVEKIYPSFVPFVELDDGTTIAAADGADKIEYEPGSVTATWRRWAVVGAKAAELVEPGLVTKVTWSIEKDSLRRTETITAGNAPVHVRRMWMALPSSATRLETTFFDGVRRDWLLGQSGRMTVRAVNADWKVAISSHAMGNDPLGRGARGPVQIHLIFDARDISFRAGESKSWEIEAASAPY